MLWNIIKKFWYKNLKYFKNSSLKQGECIEKDVSHPWDKPVRK